MDIFKIIKDVFHNRDFEKFFVLPDQAFLASTENLFILFLKTFFINLLRFIFSVFVSFVISFFQIFISIFNFIFFYKQSFRSVVSFVTKWLFSTNHKHIGSLYILLGFLSGIFGTSLSLIIRQELLSPGHFALAGNSQLIT
jgi:hypothetical protein